MRLLKEEIEDCRDCPYYERFDGKYTVYHTCNKFKHTTKADYETLMKKCELEVIT